MPCLSLGPGKEESLLLDSCCGYKPLSFAFHPPLPDLRARFVDNLPLGCHCFLAGIGQAEDLFALCKALHTWSNRAFTSLVFPPVCSRAKLQGPIPEIAVEAGEHFLQVRCETLDSGDWKMSYWGCFPELWLNPDLHDQIYLSQNDIAASPALSFFPACTFHL